MSYYCVVGGFKLKQTPNERYFKIFLVATKLTLVYFYAHLSGPKEKYNFMVADNKIAGRKFKQFINNQGY
ncbi:hypothetical protein Q7S_12750 [Rahnella aquatilis HX2]|nr:hypothetical protein Q7S_12750 [Rahnella aquatilis HX2]